MKRLSVLLLASILMSSCGGGTTDPEIARGQQLFSEHCAACHSLSQDVVIVGPSLAGIATRAANQGSDTREVLRQSVLRPQAVITEGFANLMPPDFEQKLADADIEALLSFLLTLE
jgi:nitric oxide reductase subunit C